MVRDRYNALGLSSTPSDSFEDKLTRAVVARLAVEAELPTAVDEAELKYMDWEEGTW